LWSISPLKYVDRVKTPLLILHAEDDLRCPIEQAEQFYTQLKKQEKEVEFLRFPNASHGFLQNGEPKNRIARVEAIIEWATRHLSE
jgi:dipeptidyl aminopeptidase/acylaminoacyl peptidase